MPNDIVLPFMPPVLKSFDTAWPRVQVSVICQSSAQLLKKLDAGEIDLTLTTERTSGRYAERLLQDRLVWVGTRGGQAFQQDPPAGISW